MFEGTGIEPVVLFSDAAQVSTSKKLWREHRNRVFALYGDSSSEPPKPAKVARGKAAARSKGGGGGGFGAAPSPQKEAPAGLSRVPSSAEVTFVVNPRSAQLAAVREFCEAHGDDRLVVLLNPRALRNGEAEPALCDYFDDFEPTFLFETRAKQDEEPTVLWRAFPGEYVLARKPKIGPPRELLNSESRPSAESLEAAIEKDDSSDAATKALGALGSVFKS